MTEKEWLDIGYDKNIIDVQAYEEITFHDVYKQWFLMKLKRIKEQSCDRIEVTFNKYYATSTLHDNGVPTRVISDLMGHSLLSTTENCYILSRSENYVNVYNYMQDGLKYVS